MGNIEENQPKKTELPSGRKPERVFRKNLEEAQKPPQAAQGGVVVAKDDYLATTTSSVSYALNQLYRFLYVLGIQVLRKFRKYRRRLRRGFSKVKGGLLGAIYRIKQIAHRGWRAILRQAKAPFVSVKEKYQDQLPSIEMAKSQGNKPWSSYRAVAKQVALSIGKILATIFNYAAPIAAGVLLFTVITNQINTPIGLNVVYKGEDIGIIENEKIFTKALKDVESRLVEDTGNTTAIPPLFQVSVIDEDTVYMTQEQIADGIISASMEDITSAYGLYVNDQLIGAVEEGTAITDEIEKIQQSNRTGLPNERVQFEKSIAFKEGLYPTDAVIEEKELINKINSTETVEEYYRTVEGDTPESVALEHGITLGALQATNPDMGEALEEGTRLFISQEKRFLSIKTIYTSIYEEDIAYKVIENQNPLYARGYRKIERPGVYGKGLVTADITMVDGVKISQVVTDVKHLSDPVSEMVTVGVNNPDNVVSSAGGVTSTGFAWPANGGYIGTFLGGYRGHTGVDINNSGGIGSPIFASAAGTVTKATYSGLGYGNQIWLDHGNGYVTMYAHCNELYVSAGDSVGREQIIGTVGNTGNSTGPHLHFEVRFKGQVLNPVNFVGTSGRRKI